MQTSTTLLKKPLYLWLVRIVTLGFILASIGIGVSSLPDVLDMLKNEGVTDVFWAPDPNGEGIIQALPPTAAQKGIAIGDKVLNYKEEPGKLGTLVTLQIQSGSAPARDITLLRNVPG